MPNTIFMGVDSTKLDQRRTAIDVLVVGGVAVIGTLQCFVDDQPDTCTERLVLQDCIRIVDGLLDFFQALDVEFAAGLDEIGVIVLPPKPSGTACESWTGPRSHGVQGLAGDG